MVTLGMITLVVDDYDRALAYYVDRLGFALVEDTVLDSDKRWVVVAPSSQGARMLLARARGEQQVTEIGNSVGGRVAFFLYTEDFDATYARFAAAGVEFVEEPRIERWGRVVVFRDLYANGWDLIEHRPAPGERSTT
jgi:catechol 2,3-dioxygenase-like lactoylglutathione lyase family enzyme